MNHQQSRPFDRSAWLWLAIGASLLPFASFQTVWPIAAWLSPVFLMRFCRTQRRAVGLPLIALVLCLGYLIGWRNDYIPLPLDMPGWLAGLLIAALALFRAGVASVPCVLDRLLADRLPGGLRTLVFPLAAVSIEYLGSATTGQTLGSPAYTQYGY